MPAQLMAEERGLAVDGPSFEACMQEQRQRSRAAGKAGGGPALKFEAEATAHLQRSGVSVTDDSPKCGASPDCTDIHFPFQDIQR
jgi:alanyl-tRNA synthetase